MMTLQEGDEVHIGFPGVAALDVVQRVRHDGRISVPLAGEVMAEGRTPTELEGELLRLCGPQLVTKEVRVSVVAASYPIFVSGAVLPANWCVSAGFPRSKRSWRREGLIETARI
jgi:protein involved in polysaccharide export with SLBB domain